jgi:hypothetical protein
VAEQGIAFTAIGIITSDPASVESVLSWATRLQDRASYVIVENAAAPQADFSYWRNSEQAKRFREVFQPVTITMEFRLAELENPARQHGITLGQIAERKTQAPELQKASLVMRAQSYPISRTSSSACPTLSRCSAESFPMRLSSRALDTARIWSMTATTLRSPHRTGTRSGGLA